MFHVRKFRVLRTSQMIAVGFAGLIFVGAVLLWMPFCTAKGETTAFTDAFFTAATSVCVTGLVTVQTSSHWSAAGKAVILLLIQAGGIGVISLAGIFFIGFHRKISLRSRRMIQESYHMDRPEGMVLLVRRIVCCVLCAEAVGAVCYSLCFIPRFGFAAGICQSVFTAVSAFCNAGIDLFGPDSLTPYVRNLPVNLITIGLFGVVGYCPIVIRFCRAGCPRRARSVRCIFTAASCFLRRPSFFWPELFSFMRWSAQTRRRWGL